MRLVVVYDRMAYFSAAHFDSEWRANWGKCESIWRQGNSTEAKRMT